MLDVNNMDPLWTLLFVKFDILETPLTYNLIITFTVTETVSENHKPIQILSLSASAALQQQQQ